MNDVRAADTDSIRGWQFGKGMYFTDAACKAAQYGFTAVDRTEGFLLLSIVGLGDHLELPAPEKVRRCTTHTSSLNSKMKKCQLFDSYLWLNSTFHPYVFRNFGHAFWS